VVRVVSEGWIVQVRRAVGGAAQILVEAMDLITVAGFEEIQHVMEEVVDLHDRIVAEPGHGERADGKMVGGKRGRG
jgi:hypothetical protein